MCLFAVAVFVVETSWVTFLVRNVSLEVSEAKLRVEKLSGPRLGKGDFGARLLAVPEGPPSTKSQSVPWRIDSRCFI